MNGSLIPRLNHIDHVRAQNAFNCYDSHIPTVLRMIDEEPEKLVQIRYHSLAGDYERRAFYGYALGQPLENIRKDLADAARAFARVLELRGTASPFPAYITSIRRTSVRESPEDRSDLKSLHSANDKDYSVTNAKDNYLAACEALIAGEEALACALAKMIWDPPGATYIGPNSFCTPNDQCLAYGLRACFEGNVTAVGAELGKVNENGVSPQLSYQATMLLSINSNDRRGFIESLSRLVAWHRKKALSKKERDNPELFMCVAGLGLCRLAVLRKICSIDNFPAGDVFLPVEMLRTTEQGSY